MNKNQTIKHKLLEFIKEILESNKKSAIKNVPMSVHHSNKTKPKKAFRCSIDKMSSFASFLESAFCGSKYDL